MQTKEGVINVDLDYKSRVLYVQEVFCQFF